MLSDGVCACNGLAPTHTLGDFGGWRGGGGWGGGWLRTVGSFLLVLQAEVWIGFFGGTGVP